MKSKLFSPSQISKMSDAAINAAYSTLRSIANKRLQRMQAQNIGRRARTGFRFPTIKDIQQSSKWNVSSMLADVSMWLRSDRTTIKGEKKAIADFQQTMSDMGFGDLVDSLDKTYGLMDYLDDLREKYGDKVYSSGDALEIYQHAQDLKIPKDVFNENYDKFLENRREFMNMAPNKNNQKIGSKRLGKLIKKWSK